MINLFLSILNMSLKASYVILVVMLIRLLFKKAPRFASYALWGVVAFRLIMPFSFESILSIMPKSTNTNPILHDLVYQKAPQINNGLEAVDNIVNNSVTVANNLGGSVSAADLVASSVPAANAVASVNPIQIYMFIASCIWIAGIVALLIYSLVSVIRLKKRLKDAHLSEDNIFEASNIRTPFVLGIVRPRIYLPAGLNNYERDYIILHEQTHIRRKDHVTKIIAFIILSIHWFNPLAWIAFVLMSTDMELSCDEHVLKQIEEDVKKPYANSLLSLALGGHIINGSPLAFGEGNVKGRIKNVLNYRKPSFWMILVSIIAVTIISIALITNPKQGDPIQKDEINVEDSISSGDDVSEDSINKDTDISDNSIQQDDYEAVNTPVKTGEVYQTEYNGVKIEFASEMMGFKATNEFETTNYRIVAYIDTILKGGNRVSIVEDDLNNNYTNQYVIKLSNHLSESSCTLYYDTLYDKAYFQKYNGLYEVEVDFARYIDSFLENSDIDVNIDDTAAVALFEMYGWTLNYKINSMKQKINNINSLGAFNPNAYYFAYNNELSKDIGLDMSGYSNTSDITVDIYRIGESMPKEFYPIQNGRGIVVKDGNIIIGAFISAGRHSAFNACSLKGNSFEEVTGQNFNVWLTDMVRVDEFEDKISTLEPEQVIEEYFLALDKKDANAAQYYISREVLLRNLTSNMLNEELFNERVSLPLTGADIGARSSLDNLKSAKLIKIESINDSNKKSKIFAVTMDMQYKKEMTISINSGEQFWNCIMVYESPQTGWKIVEFGH
jgi:beta-lactamase regulating signal transducer with metallopeptidase domain